MDKQQATQYTLDRLRTGHGSHAIADELCRLLNAPPEITKRFVDQVIAQHPEAIPPSPSDHTSETRNGKQSISTEAPIEPDRESVSESVLQFSDSELPPNLQALLDRNDVYVAPSTDKPDQVPLESANTDLPRQAKFVPSGEMGENAKDGEESRATDLEELSEYVLDQLKKQRRHNDIVETVCHRTGWHWNKSQRFVARVKTKNHDQLQSRQNKVTIILGIAIIVVGLLMTMNGASTIADYAKIAAFAKTNPEALLSISPQPVIFALAATITGIGMIVGGGFGVGRAMTNN